MLDKIQIAFCINDAYAQHMAVTIASILAHNPNEFFSFHVLHFDISAETEGKVKELQSQYPNNTIDFHKIERSWCDGLSVSKCLSHVTTEAYLRFFIPTVLKSEQRAIYMDVDVICVGRLRPLWEYDLRSTPIAAIPEYCDSIRRRNRLGLNPDGLYFCSGLLVMDLDAMRAEDAPQALVAIAKNKARSIIYADQDPINMHFDGRITPLPSIWNCSDRWSLFRRDVRQWHFQCQTRKPWCNIWKNTTWPIYLKYLLKSPYRNNALRFVWGHIKGFFFFKYTKNCMTRYLICGIRVWRRNHNNTCEAI